MSSWICVWYEPRASGGSKFKNNPGLLCYTPGFLLWGVLYKFDVNFSYFLLSIRQLVRRFLLYTWGCILFSGVLIALLHPSYIYMQYNTYTIIYSIYIVIFYSYGISSVIYIYTVYMGDFYGFQTGLRTTGSRYLQPSMSSSCTKRLGKGRAVHLSSLSLEDLWNHYI